MGRVDFDAEPYFKFENVTEVCKSIPDPNYCRKNLNCYSCQTTDGCIFEDGVCRNGTAFEQIPSLKELNNACGSEGNDEQDVDVCGEKMIDIEEGDPDDPKPSTKSLKYTTCLYLIFTSNAENFITDELLIKIKATEEVYVSIKRNDDIETQVIPIPSSRMLQEDNDSEDTEESESLKQLTEYTYNIEDAKSISVIYRANKFETTSGFKMELRVTPTTVESYSLDVFIQTN